MLFLVKKLGQILGGNLMSRQVLNQTEKKMMEAEKALARDLGSIRAGRANASLLEGIQIGRASCRERV